MRFNQILLLSLVLLAACSKDAEFDAVSDNKQFAGQTDKERSIYFDDTAKKTGRVFIAEAVKKIESPTVRGYTIRFYDPLRNDLSAEMNIYRAKRQVEGDTVLFSGEYKLSATLPDSGRMTIDLSFIEDNSSLFFRSIQGLYLKAYVINLPDGSCRINFYSHQSKNQAPPSTRRLKGTLRFKLKG